MGNKTRSKGCKLDEIKCSTLEALRYVLNKMLILSPRIFFSNSNLDDKKGIKSFFNAMSNSSSSYINFAWIGNSLIHEQDTYSWKFVT